MLLEHKTFPLKEWKIAGQNGDAGSLEGYASRFGTIDSYGDTIDPGAYTDTIPQFLTRGFIGWGHNWNDPIGIVTGAAEDSTGLLLQGEFHSDPAAQVYRTRTRERLAAGKFMGLSIGYETLASEERTVDQPYRGMFGELTDKVRALTKIRLFEVSIVTVPAEENSGVTSVKRRDMPLHEELAQVLAAVGQANGRVESLADLRASEGRKRGQRISRTTRTELEAIAEALAPFAGASERIRTLLASEEEDAPPEKRAAEGSALFLEFQQTLARLNGVPVGS